MPNKLFSFAKSFMLSAFSLHIVHRTSDIVHGSRHTGQRPAREGAYPPCQLSSVICQLTSVSPMLSAFLLYHQLVHFFPAGIKNAEARFLAGYFSLQDIIIGVYDNRKFYSSIGLYDPVPVLMAA